VIANLATTDADTNSGFVYALAAGSSPGFAVSPAGVVTRIGTGMASNTTYTLNISSTDTTGATRTETFTITTGTNSTFLTSGANNLTAGNTDSVFYGSGGNDTLTGGNGNDNLFGQSGNDILNGGSGNDNLAGGSGNDIINGGSGNDTIVVDIDDDPNENDVISGGADIDTLSIIDTGAGGETLTVAYNGTRITQIEGSGSIAADVEAVNADLGAGADTLSYAGSTASVTVNLGTGAASGFGSITSIENVTGGSGADNLTGDAIGNSLNGGAGNDTVNGGDGVDTLNGGAGNDTVNGGDGNDFIDQSAMKVVTSSMAASAPTLTGFLAWEVRGLPDLHESGGGHCRPHGVGRDDRNRRDPKHQRTWRRRYQCEHHRRARQHRGDQCQLSEHYRKQRQQPQPT
jgi:Ca2+-binding RTX toxin-like protein